MPIGNRRRGEAEFFGLSDLLSDFFFRRGLFLNFGIMQKNLFRVYSSRLGREKDANFGVWKRKKKLSAHDFPSWSGLAMNLELDIRGRKKRRKPATAPHQIDLLTRKKGEKKSNWPRSHTGQQGLGPEDTLKVYLVFFKPDQHRSFNAPTYVVCDMMYGTYINRCSEIFLATCTECVL